MSSSKQIPTGLNASTIEAMDQLGEQTQQMLDQEIQNEQFSHQNLIWTCLSCQMSPQWRKRKLSLPQDQAMNLERLRKKGQNLKRRLPRAANSISVYARFAIKGQKNRSTPR